MIQSRSNIAIHTGLSDVCVGGGKGGIKITPICRLLVMVESERLYGVKEVLGKQMGVLSTEWVSSDKNYEDLGTQEIQKEYTVRNLVWFKHKLCGSDDQVAKICCHQTKESR